MPIISKFYVRLFNMITHPSTVSSFFLPTFLPPFLPHNLPSSLPPSLPPSLLSHFVPRTLCPTHFYLPTFYRFLPLSCPPPPLLSPFVSHFLSITFLPFLFVPLLSFFSPSYPPSLTHSITLPLLPLLPLFKGSPCGLVLKTHTRLWTSTQTQLKIMSKNLKFF